MGLDLQFLSKYISGEDDVPTCIQYDDDWENQFFTRLGSSQEDSESLPQEDLDEEEGKFDLEPAPPKITRYQDAIASLEAVQVKDLFRVRQWRFTTDQANSMGVNSQ